MSDNYIIIMSSPRKSDNMNMQYNTGVRCDSIQSGVTTSGQVYQYQMSIYQVSSDSMSIIRCQISSIRYQVSSDNMSSMVSGIKCKV